MINYIVLAAGKGSRMRVSKPKCSIPILGKAMINYTLDTIRNIGFNQLLCIVGYKKEELLSSITHKDDITFVHQERPLGTGDAVKSALPFLSPGYCIIVSGDSPILNKKVLEDLFTKHRTEENDLTLYGWKASDSKNYGTIQFQNNAPKRIVEASERQKNNLKEVYINSGIYCINVEVLKSEIAKIKNTNSKKEFYLTDLVEICANRYKIGLMEGAEISGINEPYELLEYEEDLRRTILFNHTKHGVRFLNPKTITIGIDVKIEDNVTIQSGSVILGKTVLSSGCTIGTNCVILDSYIGDSSIVESSYIRNSMIGKNTTIGPFAHIRENSIIQDQIRIGNFVEVKTSTIKNGTKAAHLTYIGNTDCGENVNFGCGVITCNYDGKNKHKTIIEDNVFIGSNTNLIAPVHINSNSYIAAGTTVTEDVGDGEFVIGRVRQTKIKKP